MDWELDWIKRRKWAEPWPSFSVSWGWMQGSSCLMPVSAAMPSSPLCIFTRPMGQNKTFLPLAPIQIYFLKPGTMVYKRNSRIQKAEAGGSQVKRDAWAAQWDLISTSKVPKNIITALYISFSYYSNSKTNKSVFIFYIHQISTWM